jgi:hypothetical protein
MWVRGSRNGARPRWERALVLRNRPPNGHSTPHDFRLADRCNPDGSKTGRRRVPAKAGLCVRPRPLPRRWLHLENRPHAAATHHPRRLVSHDYRCLSRCCARRRPRTCGVLCGTQITSYRCLVIRHCLARIAAPTRAWAQARASDRSRGLARDDRSCRTAIIHQRAVRLGRHVRRESRASRLPDLLVRPILLHERLSRHPCALLLGVQPHRC